MTDKKKLSWIAAIGYSIATPFIVQAIDDNLEAPPRHVGHAIVGAGLFAFWNNVYNQYK